MLRLFVSLVFSLFMMKSYAVTLYIGEIVPYFFQEGSENKGIGVDLFKDLCKKAGLPIKIEYMPWSRAIETAATDPEGVILFSKTAEREKSFNFLVHLEDVKNDYVFIFFKSSGKFTEDIDKMRDYDIGVQLGTPGESMLKEKGFKKINVVSNNDSNIKKLGMGRIDAWFSPYLQSKYLVKKDFEKAKDKLQYGTSTIGKTPFYLSVSKKMDQKIADKLKVATETLVKEGKVKEIIVKYTE